MKLAAICLTFLLSGCSHVVWQAKHDFEISSAPKFEQSSADKLTYNDANLLINFGFEAERRDITLNVLNKSEQVIKLIWDESVFIDMVGQSSRMMQNDVLTINKDGIQPPAVIPSGRRLTSRVHPASNVKEGAKGFYLTSLIPGLFVTANDGQQDKLIAEAKKFKGKEVLEAILVFEIQESKKQYHFKFNLVDSTITRIETPLLK
jgi:hypothetical protein